MRIGIDRPLSALPSIRRAMSSADRAGLPIVAACAVAACVASWIFCLRQGITGPLWLDEAWTGAFASEPSLAGLAEQARNDASAPLYYFVMWLWARAFGLSNLSMHVPSLGLAIATPVLAWAGLWRSRPTLACVWAALLGLWIPGIAQAGDARCYALLSFLSVATAVAMIRAYEVPTRGRAAVWATGASLMTLTHYFAGPLALIQGLILTARYRGRWREAWPAALAFLPAFAWIAWHAPRLAAFARPGVAWYDSLTLSDLPTVLSVFLGPPLSEAAVPAALAMSVFLGVRAAPGAKRLAAPDRPVIAVGLASLAAVAFCLVLGALRPAFTFRYLTPFAPGILLLVAAGIVAASRSRWQPLAVLIGGSLVSVSLAVASEDVAVSKAFTFEAASAWIAEAAPPRLAFFWDNPQTQAEAPSQLDAIGGFFLRRGGLKLDVKPVYAIRGADMSGPMEEAAGPDGAILWLYDTTVHDTTATLHPPRLGAIGGLECRNFGIFNVGVLACRHAG